MSFQVQPTEPSIQAYKQAANNIIAHLTQAAKTGNIRKLNEQLQLAERIQENLLNEIYRPGAENREELLELIKNIEIEIQVHQKFFEKHQPQTKLESIISRMALAVKKFFTLNPTQRKLADAILSAEQAILKKEGLSYAKLTLEDLREKIVKENAVKGAVYDLSTLALRRLEAYLPPPYKSQFEVEHPAELVELLLKGRPLKGYDYVGARKHYFFEKALEGLSIPKGDISNLSTEEAVKDIAVLVGLKKHRSDLPIDARFHLLLNKLQENPGLFDRVQKELKKYPLISQEFNDYLKKSYIRLPDLVNLLFIDQPPFPGALEALPTVNIETYGRPKEEIANKIGILLLMKRIDPASESDLKLVLLLNNLRGDPKRWKEVQGELEKSPTVIQREFGEYFRAIYKRKLTEDSLSSSTSREEIERIHALVEQIDQGDITEKTWRELSKISSQDRTKLFQTHHLREKLTPFAEKLYETITQSPEEFPLKDVQLILSTLILTEDVLSRDVIGDVIKLAQKYYLEEKPKELAARVETFPEILEAIRLKNPQAAEELERLFISVIGNLCRDNRKILGDLDTPLKQAIALKALERENEELFASGLRAKTAQEVQKILNKFEKVEDEEGKKATRISQLQERMAQLAKEEAAAKISPLTPKLESRDEALLREVGLLTKESPTPTEKTEKKEAKRLVEDFKALYAESKNPEANRSEIFKKYIALERIVQKSGITLPPDDRKIADSVEAALSASNIDDLAKIPSVDVTTYINAFVRGPFSGERNEGAKIQFWDRVKKYFQS